MSSPSPRRLAVSVVAALVCTVLALVALAAYGVLPAFLLMLLAVGSLALPVLAPVVAEERRRQSVE